MIIAKITSIKLFIVSGLCLLSVCNISAQNRTGLQVNVNFAAWNVDRYSYKEHLTDDRVTYESHHSPSLGIGAIRTTDHGYWGLGLVYKYNRIVFSYKIDAEFRDMFGFPMEGLRSISFTNVIEQNKLGLFGQYFHKINDKIGLKGSLFYDFIITRDLNDLNYPLVGFGRKIGDISYKFTEYDLLIIEKNPLQRFSFYLGGVYQPVPALEFSCGVNYLPTGSLLAERKEFLNDELNSHLEVWDRYLILTLGVSYTYIRKKQ